MTRQQPTVIYTKFYESLRSKTWRPNSFGLVTIPGRLVCPWTNSGSVFSTQQIHCLDFSVINAQIPDYWTLFNTGLIQKL